MNSDTKKPWLSKTVWLNSLMAILGIVVVFDPAASVVSAWISAHGVEIGVFWSVLNVALRAITKDKLSLAD